MDASTTTAHRSADDALAGLAEHLRQLHRRGDPLVLVNVWDAASARHVEGAGAAAVGTSSAAVAASVGVPDDNTMEPVLVFEAIRRVADAVGVPVTADVEGGYGLDGRQLVSGLLGAGAVGCNLEDSDHRRPGHLVGIEEMAERLAELRAAASASGIPIVVNGRIDTFVHGGSDRDQVIDETIRRARRYLEAGADCVYPVRLGDPALAARIVTELDAAVNVNLAPGVTVADMAAAGASRVSTGPMAHAVVMSALRQHAVELLGGGS